MIRETGRQAVSERLIGQVGTRFGNDEGNDQVSLADTYSRTTVLPQKQRETDSDVG